VAITLRQRRRKAARYDPGVTEPRWPALSLDGLDAVVFETDGVLTDTALAVATHAAKPVVVVPPDPRDPPPTGLHRVLVPLDGTADTARSVEQTRTPVPVILLPRLE
jgi:hypothetical protein